MISEFREQILQLRRSEMDAEYLANESFMEWILTGIANSNARKTRLREEIDRALERANNCLSNVERARDQLGEEREARSRQQHEHHAEQLQTILHRLRQRQDS
jgi:CCR4-NOT transcriptional regulation complex NOT5 subunit